jgi:hypothetical protein
MNGFITEDTELWEFKTDDFVFLTREFRVLRGSGVFSLCFIRCFHQ